MQHCDFRENAGPGTARTRRPNRPDGSAHRNHRPRRLLHPDEHGVAADVAGRHPQPEVPEVARRRVQRGRHRPATCRPASARARGVAAARTSRPTTSSCCYPDDLDKFIGPDTRVVAVSTHNPLGVTFAAGVYTSIFGIVEAADQLALRARAVRRASRRSPYRANFKVIVGGSGGWQITQTNTWDELGVDCVVEGRERIGRRRWSCSTRRSRGEDAAAAGGRRPSEGSRRASSFPTSAPPSAWSR